VSAAWGPYSDTVLHFPEAGLTVDLRLALPGGIPQRFAELGLGASFAVVTACNPLDTLLEAPANERLTRVFERVVRERYPGATPAHGRSPDGKHEEPGWAIPAHLTETQRLATEFLQNALFWFDGERFFIVPVLAPGPHLPLPAAPSVR